MNTYNLLFGIFLILLVMLVLMVAGVDLGA